MPQFSVVMPVYNREKLVSTALDSVLSQPDFDDEIIVVDDGSTDQTLAVLASYGDRIHVLQQKNSGPGAARSLGIEAARGDYIAFLDSDDLWLPWTLQTLRHAIQTSPAPPALLIGSELRFERDEQLPELIQNAEGAPKTEFFADYLSASRHAIWFGASSLAVRTDALREVGGFTRQWINAEDLDLCLKLGAAPSFAWIQSPTFAYRQHAGSAVADISRNLEGVRHLIAQEKRGSYPGGVARKRQRWEILTRHVRPVALECLRRGEKRAAWELYRATFGWHFQTGRAKFLGAFPILALRSNR